MSRAYGVAYIRAQIQTRVDDTSLRTVATGVGLSPNAVRGFLNGARPHSRNLAKYIRFLNAKPADLPARGTRQERADMDAAIEYLHTYINANPRDHDRRFREVLRRLAAERSPGSGT